tara:strand:- start:12353 stop:13432 length:1080 start_codon:yes stop_codon:yes gene_type:complete
VINIESIINDGINKSSQSKTWGGHDRNQTVGASEIGTCLRRLVFSKHNAEPDPDFIQDLGAAERGNIIEDWLEQTIKDSLPFTGSSGLELIWSGDNQQTLVHGKQSATPDGLIVHKKGLPFEIFIQDEVVKVSCLYVEIKSIDPRPFDSLNQPKPNHVLQCRQGMQLTYIKSGGKYTPTYAMLIYINASFLNQVKIFKVERDTNIALHLEQRAKSVWDEYSLDNLPLPEGKIEGGKECQYCAWRKQCQGIEVDSIPSHANSNYVEAVEHRVRDLAVQRKKLHAVTKSDSVRLKELDQEIMEVLREADTRKVSGDWGSVTAFSAKSPPRYSPSLFEEKGLNPKDFQTEGDYSPRLNITIK